MKLWWGGGEVVNHSSVWASHGLLPATMGLRQETQRLTSMMAKDTAIRTDPAGREVVPDLETGVGGIDRDPAGHALHPDVVLRREGQPEADEQEPEVGLAEPLPQHLARELRIPEVEAGKAREDGGSEEHLVEVRHHEIGVMDGEVDRR